MHALLVHALMFLGPMVQGLLSRASHDFVATRAVGAKARKAAELLQHQAQIDKQVSQQWGNARASGAAWAGQVGTSRRQPPESLRHTMLPAMIWLTHGDVGHPLSQDKMDASDKIKVTTTVRLEIHLMSSWFC